MSDEPVTGGLRAQTDLYALSTVEQPASLPAATDVVKIVCDFEAFRPDPDDITLTVKRLAQV